MSDSVPEHKDLDKLTVTMRNELMRGKYKKMDLIERRLIYIALSKTTHSEDDFGAIKFSVAEYAELVRRAAGKDTYQDGQNTLEQIKEGCRRLMLRVVEIDIGDKWETFHWISGASCDMKKRIVTMKFHEDMKPFLLWLAEELSSRFLLKYALPLSSTYSQKLYEYFRSMVDFELNRKFVQEYNLAEFREIAAIENSYPLYANLKARVLIPAIKDINEKTDISIAFMEMYCGKRVGGLKFGVAVKDEASPWAAYTVYKKSELADRIIRFIKNNYNEDISSIKFDDYSENLVARLLQELEDKVIDLSKTKAIEPYIIYKLSTWTETME